MVGKIPKTDFAKHMLLESWYKVVHGPYWDAVVVEWLSGLLDSRVMFLVT